MASGDACLLNSNILLRISKSDDPQHAAISFALRVMVGQGRGSATPRRLLASSEWRRMIELWQAARC